MVKTYSLLQKHEEVIVYRIPDPTGRTHAYVEVGLYPWKLEGASIDEMLTASIENREPIEETFEGLGLRLNFRGPTRYHPSPSAPEETIKEQFDIKTSGGGRGGSRFRIQNTSPAELREAARSAAHYAFCYWWALDQHDDFTPGVERNEGYTERRERLSIIHDVHEDGTVVYTDKTTTTAPYTLDDYELLPSEDWNTPEENCEDAFNDLLDELLDTYPERAVMAGYKNADIERIYTQSKKTEELQKTEELRDKLIETVDDAEGIGGAMRRFICNEFDSMEDLCTDIRNGGDRLRSHSHIGETVENTLIDALIEHGYWVPESDDS